MKKIIIYISLLLLILSVNCFGFTERRQQWWESRLENLQKENSSIENGIIKNVLLKDIDTTKTVISIFKNSQLGIEQINEGRFKFTNEEIKRKSEPYVNAAFNLYYLKQILKFEQFNEDFEPSKLFLHTYTQKYLNKHFPNVDDAFTANFIKENELSYYRKYLVLENFLQESINNYDILNSIASDNILNSINAAASQKGEYIFEYELNEIIEKSIMDYYSANTALTDFNCNESTMANTWVINTMNMHYLKKVEQYKLVAQLLEYVPTDKNINKLDYYDKRPEILEQISFQYFKSNLLNNEKYDFIKNGQYAPTEPDLVKLFTEIDNKKLNFSKAINGFENTDSYKNFENSFNASISAHLRQSALFFETNDDSYKNEFIKVAGESEISTASAGTNHKPSSIENISFEEYLKKNYSNYYRSKIVYVNKLNAAKKYAKYSALYLQWLSSSKNLSEEKIETAFNYRVDKNREYADFILLLDNSLTSLAGFENRDFTNNIFSAYGQISTLFNTINQSLSIETRERPHLTNSKFTLLNKKRESEIAANNNSIQVIQKNRHLYNARQNELASIRKKRDEETKRKLAQYEVSVISENINNYIDTYSKLKYAEDVFSSYETQYSALDDKCRKGIFPAELDDVLKSGTLFSLVKNYDSKKMQTETEAKIYLQQIIQRDMVKIKSLLQYYKTQNIELIKAPSLADLNEKLKNMNNPVQVKISAWTMTETNFTEVDKKAVINIRQTYLKTAWNANAPDANTKIEKNPDEVYSYSKHGVQITIPFGWETETLTEKEVNSGIIASFKNIDDLTEFKIASMDKKTSPQDSAEKWIKTHGYAISQIGWSKVNSENIYWNISKDKENNVVKIFSFENNGKIYLFYGKSSKKLFPFFSRRFDNVINSVILSR